MFCASLYKAQMEAGRYFPHEHHESASSWQEACMKEIASDPTVMMTTVDQCAYGLLSKDKLVEGPAKKPTRFLANSVGMGLANSQMSW